MRFIPALLFLSLAAVAAAGDNPYNENADAKPEIKQALTQAAVSAIWTDINKGT
jgi:hypothetical protein